LTRTRPLIIPQILNSSHQVVNDEDKAAYLDISTHKLEKQMRDAVAASTATPLLTFSLPQLTLNLAPLRDAVSSMHFQENLVPPASTDLTSPEGTRNSLLITWKCEAREDRPNTFILQRALFGDGRTSDEWEEVYRGPSRTTTDANLDPQTSYRFVSKMSVSNMSAREPIHLEVLAICALGHPLHASRKLCGRDD
jgi:hypothetical protein